MYGPRVVRPIVVVLALAGCQSAHHAIEIDAAAPDASSPRGLPALVSSDQLCKLLSDRNMADPTPNNVQFRSNLFGADLGIPVAAGDSLYLLFGDSIGFAGIWGNGESHPDSVGHVASTAAAADPSVLCHDLGIISLPASASIGPSVDPRIAADFAGPSMTAPPGHALGEFIRNPAGPANSTFANLPGDFEVPSGAFAVGDAIYVFYTSVVSRADVTMKGAYLARWAHPAPAGPPAYDILYAVDERFDANGPLHGDFINIAAEVAGDYVYLFGTGEYRASPIHLARKRVDALATPGGFERFDAATGAWLSDATTPAAPIIDAPGYGETSARYFASIDRWIVLAEEQVAGMNRIVAHVADHPEGPWSASIVVHDMADPAYRAAYCCVPDDSCQGAQFLDCDRTGFYGSYLLPYVRTSGDRFTVAYTLSSFAPYNVALFEATFTSGL